MKKLALLLGITSLSLCAFAHADDSIFKQRGDQFAALRGVNMDDVLGSWHMGKCVELGDQKQENIEYDAILLIRPEGKGGPNTPFLYMNDGRLPYSKTISKAEAEKYIKVSNDQGMTGSEKTKEDGMKFSYFLGKKRFVPSEFTLEARTVSESGDLMVCAAAPGDGAVFLGLYNGQSVRAGQHYLYCSFPKSQEFTVAE